MRLVRMADEKFAAIYCAAAVVRVVKISSLQCLRNLLVDARVKDRQMSIPNNLINTLISFILNATSLRGSCLRILAASNSGSNGICIL